jgi:hypothetical protein
VIVDRASDREIATRSAASRSRHNRTEAGVAGRRGIPHGFLTAASIAPPHSRMLMA